MCEWSESHIPALRIENSGVSESESSYIVSDGRIGLTISGYSKEFASMAITAINEMIERMYYSKKGSPTLLPLEKIDYVYFVDPEILSSEDLAKRIKFTKKLKGQPAIRLCLNTFSF